MRKSFAERLQGGDILLGAGVSLADPLVAELLAGSFAWLFVDMEHAPLTVRDVQGIAIAATGTEASVLVRVPWNDPVVIKQVLDTGVDGIIVPMVNGLEEAERAVQAAWYPPAGIRGVGPRRANDIGRRHGYVQQANATVVVVIQVESVAAVRVLPEILGVSGISAVLIGPADLAASMDHLGDDRHPSVESAVNEAIDLCRSSGVPVGTAIGYDLPRSLDLIDRGMQFLCVGGDLGYMVHAAETLVRSVRDRGT